MALFRIKQFFRLRFYFMPGYFAGTILNILPSWRVKNEFINCFFRSSAVHRSVTIHGGLRILMTRNLVIGKGSTVNSCCLLDTRHKISIGKDTMIGHNTKIYTLGHDYNSLDFRAKGGDVRIGNKVVIFSDSKIMPGVCIGDGSVIFPGSVVVRDVPERSLVGGNPAKIIGKRETLHKSSMEYRYHFAL